MLLREFDDDSTDAVLLTGIVSQIYNRVKDTGFDKKYRLESILQTLSDRGIDLDRDTFIKMSQRQPLKNLIANVEGDSVVFKGASSDSDSEASDMDATTGTLEKMAKRAEKKREKP